MNRNLLFIIFTIIYQNFNAQTWEKVFDEQFIDNSNNWNISNTLERKSEIIGGKLIDEFHEKDKVTLNLISLDFDDSKDYKINFGISNLQYGFRVKIKNVFTQSGFVWSFKDWNNYNYIIFQQGYYNYYNTSKLGTFYKIGSVVGGSEIIHIDWRLDDNLKTETAFNQIKIEKSGNNLRFYSGSSYFASCPSENWFSNKCGIYIGDGAKVVLDYLTIEEFRDKTESYEESIIEVPNESQSSSGSGIILSKNGYIATNHHVIDGAKHLEVDVFIGGVKNTYLADVVSSDVSNDLSLIKIRDEKFVSSALQYGIKTQDVKVGEKVFSMGYPMIDLQGNEIKLTDGIISSKSGFQNDPTTYQITAPIQPGNSGGPLFDSNGYLIGITSSKLNSSDAQNVNYAIKISYLLNFLDIQSNLPKLPTQSLLTGKPLTEMVTKLSPVVVLIRVNDKTIDGNTSKNGTNQKKDISELENTGYISNNYKKYIYSSLTKQFDKTEELQIESKFCIIKNALFFKKGNQDWLKCNIEKWSIDDNGDYYCFDNQNQKIVINKSKTKIIFYSDYFLNQYMKMFEYSIIKQDNSIKPQ